MKPLFSKIKAVSIFGLNPVKIGGIEAFARELSCQLAESGGKSILCFDSPPPENVRRYFDLPNVVLETVERPYYPWLIRLLLRHRPNILHVHFISLFSPFVWLARFLGVGKIFYTEHHSRLESRVVTKSPFWKKVVYRAMMAPLDKVFCVSRFVCDSMMESGQLPAGRLEVVYNGADLQRVSAGTGVADSFRQTYGIPVDSFLVMQVGQLRPEKGIDDLLEAARLVAAVNSKIHFVLIGEGAHLDEYRIKARLLGIETHVTFTGALEDPIACGAYDAADLVCLLARWDEAFGLVIAEAMAAAKPLLVTRVGGIPELVLDGVNGFVVMRSDTSSMSDRILQLAADPELCARLGMSGLEICREKFDLKKNVRQLLSHYGINSQPQL